MRCMIRNKRTIYVCERYQDNKISKYKEPIKLDVNYQCTNSEGDLIALGLNYPEYIRIKTDLDKLSLFHPHDRVYVGVKPNETFDELCKDATYEVDSDPIISLNVVEVTLQKLSGKR